MVGNYVEKWYKLAIRQLQICDKPLCKPTGIVLTDFTPQFKKAFWVTHQTKWPVKMDQVLPFFWTSVQRPFSKHSPDPPAICSLFDKESLFATWPCSSSLDCRTVFVQHGVTRDGWAITHQRQYERGRAREKTAIRRRWEKSFHHISNVFSCVKPEIEFFEKSCSTGEVPTCATSSLTHGENETSEELASLKQFELQQFWGSFGKHEVLDLFCWLSCCLAAASLLTGRS